MDGDCVLMSTGADGFQSFGKRKLFTFVNFSSHPAPKSPMPRSPRQETLSAIEENQAELRKNIEASRNLIAKSDELLDRYREQEAEEAGGKDH